MGHRCARAVAKGASGWHRYPCRGRGSGCPKVEVERCRGGGGSVWHGGWHRGEAWGRGIPRRPRRRRHLRRGANKALVYSWQTAFDHPRGRRHSFGGGGRIGWSSLGGGLSGLPGTKPLVEGLLEGAGLGRLGRSHQRVCAGLPWGCIWGTRCAVVAHRVHPKAAALKVLGKGTGRNRLVCRSRG